MGPEDVANGGIAFAAWRSVGANTEPPRVSVFSHAAGVDFGATAGFDLGCVQFAACARPLPMLTARGSTSLFSIVATPAGLDALREKALTFAIWETRAARIEKYCTRGLPPPTHGPLVLQLGSNSLEP